MPKSQIITGLQEAVRHARTEGKTCGDCFYFKDGFCWNGHVTKSKLGWTRSENDRACTNRRGYTARVLTRK